MQDQGKNKEQLIDELQSLQSRIAALETKISELEGKDGNTAEQSPPRSLRNALPTEIHVMGDFNLIQARGVNLSEDGICFEINYDIPFEMEFEFQEKLQQQRAHLIWMKQLENGRNQFGFKFVPSDSSPLFQLFR